MTLSQLIQSLDNWQTKTAAEIHAELSAMTHEVRDDQLYTWAGIVELIGSDNTNNLEMALRSVAPWSVYQLAGKGLQLSHALTQAMLEQFIANGLAFCTVLKDRGIHIEPVTDASIEDVQAVLDTLSLEARKSELIASGATRWNAYVTAVDAWDGSGEGPVL